MVSVSSGCWSPWYWLDAAWVVEAELQLQQPLGGNDEDFIDIRDGISQARPLG